MKECVLYDRACTNCGACNMCDLDPQKVCDNCGKCIADDRAYLEMPIDAVILDAATEKMPFPFEEAAHTDADTSAEEAPCDCACGHHHDH